MKNPTKVKFLTGTILSIAAVLFLVLNISSGALFKSMRLDLTENRIYTLSSGSKQILSQLSEPIVLRLYFSKKLAKSNPYLISFASRVEDLLIQYQRASNKKVIIEVIDPEPFSSEEDDALNSGLQGVPVDNTGTEMYFGLVGSNSVDVKRAIPFLQPAREASLEYDLSQLIYNLSNPQRKVVGVISSLPIQGKNSRAWVIWQQLQQAFELKTIAPTVSTIPSDVTTLMLVNPATFTNDALRAIDKFVMSGGHVLAFVDPFVEVMDAQTAKENNLHKDTSADFNRLLRSWGVRVDEDKVVTDRSLAKLVSVPNNGRPVTIRYPLWLDFVGKSFDKNDILTSTMERISLATPGALIKLDGATTKFSPLISTSADAMLVETTKIPEYQRNLDSLYHSYQPNGPFVVAARLSGPVKSPYTADESPNANIVIIADSDMLHDHFWINIQDVSGQTIGVPTSGNGNFLLGALDNLTGSDALISIRNRGAFTRPFDTIQALEVRSRDKYRESELVLQQKLELTKQKLVELETKKKTKEGDTLLLGMQQKQEADAFRKELIDTRRELRDVRRNLNQDIQVVEIGVKFFSIGFIPMLIVLGGLGLWGYQIQNEVKNRKAACSTPKR